MLLVMLLRCNRLPLTLRLAAAAQNSAGSLSYVP
jgi:hypothetical protein